MPQLNPEFFLSQLFWLFVTFFFLLIVLWRISLPRINSVLERRENKINNDIQNAKKLQTEAEEIQSQIDKELIATNEEVTQLIKESSTNFQNKISDQLKELDKELIQKIEDTAKSIESDKSNILDKIETQIKNITKLTITKITSMEISDEEINKTIKAKQRLVN